MGNNVGNNMGTVIRDYGAFYNKVDNEPTLIIKPFLYLGGAYARKNPRVLEYLGITHVLNMASELHLDTVYLNNRNISVKHIPAEDYDGFNIRQSFEEAFQFIEDALAKNGRILVHCAVGISRSPTIVIAYIMYRYGMTYQAAFQYVQSLRPNINPNNGFKMQLQEFEYELANANRLPPQQGGNPQLTAAQQQQYLTNLMAIQNRLGFIDNVNTATTNTSNFNMNGMNPISLKVGSRKNYANHLNLLNNAETAQQAHNPLNYLDQNLLYPNNNAYYIDPNAAAAAGMYYNSSLNDAQQLGNQFYMFYYA